MGGIDVSRRKKQHIPELPSLLDSYAVARALQLDKYSEYHMRLMDGGYTVLDIWTTGRYYVLTTDYRAMVSASITERGGEKGELPSVHKLYDWLDKMFFPEVEL